MAEFDWSIMQNDNDDDDDAAEAAAFQKLVAYLKAELEAAGSDYQLLQLMNNVAKEKYTEMSVLVQRLIQQSANLTNQYDAFKPYAEQVDEIEARVTYLEQLASELRDYTKHLEDKYGSFTTFKASTQ